MVDINALISDWFNLLFAYVASLNDYVIVGDVTFMGVLLAIGVFSIIVHIFFVKIISFGNAGPVENEQTERYSRINVARRRWEKLLRR